MKYKLIILSFLSLVLTSGLTYSKETDNKIDSLKQILKTFSSTLEVSGSAYDTIRINTLNSLSKEYLSIADFDNSIQYANEAIAICYKLPFSLERIQKGSLAKSYNTIGIAYWHKGEYVKALEQHFKSLKMKEEIGDKEGVCSSYQNIGLVYKKQGDYTNALEFYFKSFELQKKIEAEKPNDVGTKKAIAGLLVSIGNIYENQGDYVKALDYDFKSLKIYEEVNFKKGIATSLNNIGNVYQNQKDFTKALEQYSKSLKIKEEIGDKFGMGSALNNIACIYALQGKNSKALELYFQVLETQTELGDKSGIANALNNIGSIYYELGDYKKGLVQDFKALKINEEIGDMGGIAFSSINIGIAYVKLKEFQQAKEYFNKALSISKEMGNKVDMKVIYHELSFLDSAKGDYVKALEHYKMYVIYKDSLINEEHIKKTVQLQMQNDFDSKQTIAKAEQDKKDAINKQQKRLRDIIIGGLVLIFILSLIILKDYRQKQRTIMKLKESEMELLKMESEEVKKTLEIELLKKEAEKVKKELEIELLKKEAEEIKKEIIDFSLQSLKNKEFIELTRTELKNIKKTETQNSSINNLFAITNQFVINEQERSEFQNKVEGIQKSFFEKLDQLNSPAGNKLTKTEKKLAALLKLQLTSKEIGSILNVSETSIEIYRSRLRKKLNIDGNVSLSDYFNNI